MFHKTRQSKTKNYEIDQSEKTASTHIPYTHHYDPYTIQATGGQLIQFIRVQGIPTDTLDDESIEQKKDFRSTLLQNIADDSIAVYSHCVRSRSDEYPDGNYTPGSFSDRLNDNWQQRLRDRTNYVNEYTLSIVIKNDRGFVSRALSFGKDRKSRREHYQRLAKKLDNVTQLLVSGLQSYGAERLKVVGDPISDNTSEPLAFLHTLINGYSWPLALPHMALSQYLPTSRLFFQGETMVFRSPVQDRYGALLSVKEYSEKTFPTMMDQLLRIKHEYILCHSFQFIERQKALKMMDEQQTFFEQAEDYSESQKEEISLAMDDVQSGRVGLGYQQFSILVLADNEQGLSDAITEVQKSLAGLALVREDMNLEAAFWAQLPGNASYLARRNPVTTNNFSSFVSLHNQPIGRLDGNFWGAAVCQLESISGAPYYFNFHEKSSSSYQPGEHLIGPPKANTNIFGQSGGGKTLLMNFLVAMSQKYKPRTIYFDKDRGVQLLIEAMGGDYHIINPDQPGFMNPLQLPDTPYHRQFLAQWLATLLTSNGETLGATDVDRIHNAVEGSYKMPLEKRRLSLVAPLFGTGTAESLAGRLRPWYGNGPKAYLFDNATNHVSMDGCVGFDMTYLLEDASVRLPVNQYLLHLVKHSLDGSPTIIPIDEGWAHLKDPYFAQNLEDDLKTIRKKNGMIIFTTQDPDDAAGSGILRTVIQQTATNIFLPNNRANEQTYKAFGLTDHEVALIKQLNPEERTFLIKHGNDSVIAKLDLTGMEEVISILSASEQNLRKLKQQEKTPCVV